MFTIGKRRKIQLFLFHNPKRSELLGMIETENSETKTASDHLSRIFAKRSQDVLGITKIESELDHYGISTLKPFFLQFQSAWEELKRKINSNKSYSSGRWFIDNEKEEEILSVFLRLGRQDGIGSDIEGAFRKEVFGNSELISQIGKEPSILDSSHGSLRFLNVKNRRSFIEHMIRHGITSNNDNPGLNSEKEAMEALPEILEYLKSIFQIDFFTEYRNIRTVRALSDFIVDQIWSESSQGINAKKGWMLVKAFSAWGGMREIKKIRESALSNAEKITERFEQNGLYIKSLGKISEENPGGETTEIHSAMVGIKLQGGGYINCGIEYRVKSMRSILLKLWENEDYNNIDALKDIFGIAIILPPNTDQDVKNEIVRKMSQIMANKGYIVKNKGLISDGQMKGLRRLLNDQGKKPLGKVVQKKKGKSAKEFKNLSITGFTTIFGDPQGMEIQFHEQESYAFWKKDHYLFDPLKVISAWARGSWFITPNQVLQVVRTEIPDDIRDAVLKMRPQEIIQDYIRRGKIIAYSGENDDVYFTTEDQKIKFETKFRKAKPIDKGDAEFLDFIDSLSLSGVAGATGGTSLPTHGQGRGTRSRLLRIQNRKVLRYPISSEE